MKRLLTKLFIRIFLAETKDAQLSKPQKEILYENSWKHFKVLLIALLFLPYLAYFIQVSEDKVLLLNGLLGVIVVFGGAWFILSFGAIPETLSKLAFNLTFWMFLSFILSLEAVAITLTYIFPLLSPLIVLIFGGGYLASVKYDTADAMKIGLEPEQFKLARYGSKYFKRELGKEKAKPEKMELVENNKARPLGSTPRAVGGSKFVPSGEQINGRII